MFGLLPENGTILFESLKRSDGVSSMHFLDLRFWYEYVRL